MRLTLSWYEYAVAQIGMLAGEIGGGEANVYVTFC